MRKKTKNLLVLIAAVVMGVAIWKQTGSKESFIDFIKSARG